MLISGYLNLSFKKNGMLSLYAFFSCTFKIDGTPVIYHLKFSWHVGQTFREVFSEGITVYVDDTYFPTLV